MTQMPGNYHQYVTSYKTNTHTATVSSGASLSVSDVGGYWAITCTGTTDGTVTIKSGATTVRIFHATCYTDIHNVGQTFSMPYPGDTDYYRIYSKVYYNGSLVYNDSSLYPMPEIDSNSYIWRQYSDPDGFNIKMLKTGYYVYEVFDPVEEARNARWLFLSE